MHLHCFRLVLVLKPSVLVLLLLSWTQHYIQHGIELCTMESDF